MTDEFKPVKRTIAVAGFPYRSKQIIAGAERWVHKFATRGQTIQIDDPSDLARGENNGHFVKDDETPAAPAPVFNLSDLGLMTDEQVAELWAGKPPTIPDIETAVGTDVELAQRVLAVENAQKKPRKSLVEALEKVAAGDSVKDDETPAAEAGE